jgi:hypothetical protein
VTYSVDWLARARRDDDGSRSSILNVLWLMGSPASDLWPEKERARRVLTLVAMMRQVES